MSQDVPSRSETFPTREVMAMTTGGFEATKNASFLWILQDGAPKIAFSCLISGSMVDIIIVTGSYNGL